jgi:hypothetical protein
MKILVPICRRISKKELLSLLTKASETKKIIIQTERNSEKV